MEGPIVFKAGQRTMEGFLARPEGQGPFAGVVVIQEMFGLTESIRDAARRLSQAGHAALAVDLFSGGFKPLCIVETMKNMMQSDTRHSGTQALKAALDYLAAQPAVDPDRLGAIGFCLGGNFAIALAVEDPRVKVIAPFYGTIPASIRNFEGFCPVVGSFPGNDYTAAHARRLEAGLEVAKVPHDIKIYPGTMHSFANQQLPFYKPAAAADAWERTLEFFEAHLKG